MMSATNVRLGSDPAETNSFQKQNQNGETPGNLSQLESHLISVKEQLTRGVLLLLLAGTLRCNICFIVDTSPCYCTVMHLG